MASQNSTFVCVSPPFITKFALFMPVKSIAEFGLRAANLCIQLYLPFLVEKNHKLA